MKTGFVKKVKIEKGQSQDVDIIRISTKMTKINDQVVMAEGISVIWAEVDDPKLLDAALEAFMNFIVASSDRKMALLRAIENMEKRTETQLKETFNSMVN